MPRHVLFYLLLFFRLLRLAASPHDLIELLLRRQGHEPHDCQDLLQSNIDLARILYDEIRGLPVLELVVGLGVLQMILDLIIAKPLPEHAVH